MAGYGWGCGWCAWGLALLVPGVRSPAAAVRLRAAWGPAAWPFRRTLPGPPGARMEEVSPEIFLRADDGGLLPFGVVGVRRTTCVDPGSGLPLAVAEEIDLRLAARGLGGRCGGGSRGRCRAVRMPVDPGASPGRETDAALPGAAGVPDWHGPGRVGPSSGRGRGAGGAFPGARVTYEGLGRGRVAPPGAGGPLPLRRREPP